MNISELKIHANEVRKGIIRSVHAAKSGHPGGSLSATEVYTYLYFEEMNVDPVNPQRKTETDLYCRKGTRRRAIMQHWRKGDSFQKKIF